jgi:hypothetical protein
MNVIMAADTAITKVNRKFIVDKIGMRVKRGIRINANGMATAKATIDINIMNAIYALKAISTPPFLS